MRNRLLGRLVLAGSLVVGVASATGRASAETSARTPIADVTVEIAPAEQPEAETPEYGSHRRGSPPKQPSATMPDGAARAAPDGYARRGLAGGTPTDEQRRLLDDRELRLLREAEEVLFPRPAHGIIPGWSWDVSRPVGGKSPHVDASGFPIPGELRGRPRRAPSLGEAWLKALVQPNFEVRYESRVVKYLKFYREDPRGRAIAEAWARKSGRFAPSIRTMFAAAGLPTDLLWLSLVESGHNPSIYSPAGAAGLWQFIPGTAEMYGLTCDRWVDERLDPRRSTEAAILLLSDLHQRFGSWPLAMAAYNMGYGGLSRAIRRYNTNDFFELTRFEAGVPWETSLYVPKIMAVAIMMNNRAAFGIDGVEPDAPEPFDTVLIESGTPLQDIARAAALSVDEVRANNPQYLRDRLPPQPEGVASKNWAVRVPAGTGTGVSEKLAKSGGVSEKLVAHVVRFGETVESIAADHGLLPERVRDLNRISLREAIGVGVVILLPRGQHSPAREKPLVVVPPRSSGYPDRRRIFYEVAPGNSASEIAGALGVTVDELTEHNMLDDSARLQPGMVLQAFVPPDADLSHVRHFNDGSARVLVAGSDEFLEYFQGLEGKKRFVIRAAQGDTLATLAKRYGMTIGSIERVNRRSHRDALEEGERVVVYTERAPRRGDRASELAVVPLGPVREPAPPELRRIANDKAAD